MRILIIDDDREDTDLFCEALNDIFPEAVCTAKNDCNDIGPLLESMGPPDVIFIDGHLNTMLGITCLQEMKPYLSKSTKIIVHSGSLSPSEIDAFKTAGIDGVLLKASSYELIKSNLKDLLLVQFKVK